MRMLPGIAMVSSVFYPSIGGAQTHTLRLSQKLKARGADVLVVTRHHRGLSHYEDVGGVPVYRVGRGDSSMAVASATYMLEALRLLVAMRERYDILHCHLMISPMTIGLLARPLVGKPLVINPHRSGPIGDVAVLRRMPPLMGSGRLAAAQLWGDALVSISADIHKELRCVGISESKIWDIPNGVDCDHFRPAASQERAALRRWLHLPSGPLVVFAGRLVAEKGLDVLLDAWPGVIKRLPEARLVIVGSGPLEHSLPEHAQRLGITEQVQFVGPADDVAPYVRAADAFVLPSYAEGMPVALLEAMACGVPCVATAIPGTMQILEDGRSGRLVPACDAQALGDGLIEALTSSVARAWAAQGRQRIVGHYSLDSVVEQYLQLYSTLLHTRRAEPVKHVA